MEILRTAMQACSGCHVVVCGVAIGSPLLRAEGRPEATFTVRVGCHVDCEWQAGSWLWRVSTAGSRLCMTRRKDVSYLLSLKMLGSIFPEQYKQNY